MPMQIVTRHAPPPSRLARLRRLKAHARLVEWQDNGGLERFSRDSQPGSWEPWILYALGSWALAIAASLPLAVGVALALAELVGRV